MKTNIEFEIQMADYGEGFHCYVPETDTYFYAKDEVEAKKKGDAVIKAFISFYNKMNVDGRIIIKDEIK